MPSLDIRHQSGGISAGMTIVRAGSLAILSPLATWFPDRAAIQWFRAARLGRAAAVLPARDEAWRTVAPTYRDAVAMAGSGLPFQIVAGREYDRSGDPRRLRLALARGATVFLPQVHQVLPRLTRLMVALRATLLGPFREECSFLFIAEGHGREAMGLHHDGEADQFWLQLEGCRTVTMGRSVAAGVPADLPAQALRRGRWRTIRLRPGALLYMPPRTPHRVLCHERSLAVSLTWKALDPDVALGALFDAAHQAEGGRGMQLPANCALPGRYARLVRIMLRRAGAASIREPALLHAHAIGLTAWDVVSGQADAIPPLCADRVWTQVPACTVATGSRDAALVIAGGGKHRMPLVPRALAAGLPAMPALAVGRTPPDAVRFLIEHGVLAARDLPLRLVPTDPGALDGWRFA
jgi:mannose-6-phosphate isomerase-like protein (cupin superfamily)